MRKTYLPYAHQNIGDEDVESLVRALKNDCITTGPYIEEFEKAILNYRYSVDTLKYTTIILA